MASKREKDFEEKVEKIVEKKVSQSKFPKIIGELVGFIIFLVILYVVFPKLPFITENYSLWLPIAFWATALGTFLKILKHLTDVNFLARIFEIGELLASIYSTFWLITIFPVDFTKVGYPEVNIYSFYFLYFVMTVTVAAIFVNLIRIFAPEKSKNK